MEQKLFPFSAVVGQERMKLALILNAINPAIGGVLIRGAKGTAKSTLVRAMQDILPLRSSATGCIFHCSPEGELCSDCQKKQENGELSFEKSRMRVVDLPVNATQDRVAGTIDIEKIIKRGEKWLEPGILAYANENILYVDEVNLLEDHIVDIILDSAAMGVHHLEREGISVSHPSRFVLIGTMNPEEGDLRPQLLDRFGLLVEVTGETDTDLRILLMERRMAFEADPVTFNEAFQKEQEDLTRRIQKARELLRTITYSREILQKIASATIALELEGHRAEITTLKTSITIAAWRGESMVRPEHVTEALTYVLPHRLRRRPFEDILSDPEEILHLLSENNVSIH